MIVWKEASFFDDAEKAALGWAEAITLIAKDARRSHYLTNS